MKAVSLETGVPSERYAADGDSNGDFVSDAINLTNDTATFATPSAGQMVFGSFQQAGRLVNPAWENEDGGLYLAQADLFLSHYWYWSVPHSAAAPLYQNILFVTAGFAAVATTYTQGSPFKAKPRTRLQTSNLIAGDVSYYRQSGARYLYLSTNDINSANQPNGFFWQTTIAVEVHNAVMRFFFGLSTATANPTNVEPSTLLNSVGFIKRAADNNLCFYAAGASAGTVVDLGSDFDVFDDALGIVQEMDLTLYNPKGSAEIYWSAHNRAKGAFAKGVVASANRPADRSFLTVRGWVTNNTALATVSVGTLGGAGGRPT